MSVDGIPAIAYFITWSQLFGSFIFVTPPLFYHNISRKLSSVLKAWDHYHIHGWSLDDSVRLYVVSQIACLLSRDLEDRSCPGDCDCLGSSAVLSGNPHLSLPVNETTVMLQDVAVFWVYRLTVELILACMTDMLPVTNMSDVRSLDGARIRLRWLQEHFRSGAPFENVVR